ncbi:MAG: MBL fold metallo-hydrolase [Ruthenibacterium sp.]
MKVLHINGPYPLKTNTFLLIGNAGHAVVIDPAASETEYLDALKKEHAELTHIFLTHGHHDHVGAVAALRRDTAAKLYMNDADAKQFHMTPDVLYKDGEEICVDDMRFQVIFTPGHTPGSTCLLCDDLLFSGDTLFAGDIGRCDLEGGDYGVMQKSLRKLCDAVLTDAQVLPGHEEFSTMQEEKANNPYLQF